MEKDSFSSDSSDDCAEEEHEWRRLDSKIEKCDEEYSDDQDPQPDIFIQ